LRFERPCVFDQRLQPKENPPSFHWAGSWYAWRLKFQRVLNCFCYTGGFTVAALSGGAAHVTSIDSSGPTITKVAANVALNGFDATRYTLHRCTAAPLRKIVAPRRG